MENLQTENLYSTIGRLHVKLENAGAIIQALKTQISEYEKQLANFHNVDTKTKE